MQPNPIGKFADGLKKLYQRGKLIFAGATAELRQQKWVTNTVAYLKPIEPWVPGEEYSLFRDFVRVLRAFLNI